MIRRLIDRIEPSELGEPAEVVGPEEGAENLGYKIWLNHFRQGYRECYVEK